MSSVDLHRARTFVEIARLGSVAATADALGYTQSAVSQQLSTLERDVGLTLVDRGRRPLRLTPAGAELLPEITALLASAAAVDAAVGDLRGLRRGRVEVVAFGSALAALLPPVIAAFRAEHPGVSVGVAQGETQPALAALRGGAADVAVIYLVPGQELGDETGLVRAAIGVDPLLVLLPAGHALGARATVSVEDLAGQPVVIPRVNGPAGEFRRLADRMFGGELNVAYELDDLRAAQAFVAAGLGVVLMHGLMLRLPSPPGVLARPLEAEIGARRIEVVRVSGRRVPAARELWDALARTRIASGR